jgi:hypothetical protein
MGLKDALLELEVDTVEVATHLCTDFDRAYTEMAESNRTHYNAYFMQARRQRRAARAVRRVAACRAGPRDRLHLAPQTHIRVDAMSCPATMSKAPCATWGWG